MKRYLSLFIAFCVAFTALPFMAGDLDANAAVKKKKSKTAKTITLYASATGQSTAYLSWNKIKKQQKGYAVFRNGVPIAHLGKRLSFSDSGLSAGTAYTYQIKTYKTKKVKQWYNKATGKWQKKKPKKKFRGGSKKIVTYTYKKPSRPVTIVTAAAPQPAATKYTITFKNWDGKVLGHQSLEKGAMPSFNGTPTRAADSNYTYTFKGWSPAVAKVSGNATYTAQFNATAKSQPTTPATPTTKYAYNIKFLNEPYGNGGKTVVYVETNNPSRFNFSLGIIDKNGNKTDGNNYYSFSPLENFEEDYDDMVGLSYDTSGKYIAIVEPKCTGDCQFAIYENKNSSNVKVYSKPVHIRDYNAEKTSWEKSVIDKVCTADMSNKEKMQAICGYLLGDFKYFKNDGTYVITLLADEGIPFWKTKRLNSFTSPYLLVEFGKLLNYPLENWYEKYPQGSAEWKVNHMYVYSAADDTQFQACPANDTGTMNRADIAIFNPSTFKFWN